MPMFLAVPSMIFMPASTVVAFRSGILVSAISCSRRHGVHQLHGIFADHKAERLGALEAMASCMPWIIKTGPAMSDKL